MTLELRVQHDVDTGEVVPARPRPGRVDAGRLLGNTSHLVGVGTREHHRRVDGAGREGLAEPVGRGDRLRRLEELIGL